MPHPELRSKPPAFTIQQQYQQAIQNTPPLHKATLPDGYCSAFKACSGGPNICCNNNQCGHCECNDPNAAPGNHGCPSGMICVWNIVEPNPICTINESSLN